VPKSADAMKTFEHGPRGGWSQGLNAQALWLQAWNLGRNARRAMSSPLCAPRSPERRWETPAAATAEERGLRRQAEEGWRKASLDAAQLREHGIGLRRALTEGLCEHFVLAAVAGAQTETIERGERSPPHGSALRRGPRIRTLMLTFRNYSGILPILTHPPAPRKWLGKFGARGARARGAEVTLVGLHSAHPVRWQLALLEQASVASNSRATTFGAIGSECVESVALRRLQTESARCARSHAAHRT
jgi:hypothetical protein